MNNRAKVNLLKTGEITDFGAAAPNFRRYLEEVEKLANLVCWGEENKVS